MRRLLTVLSYAGIMFVLAGCASPEKQKAAALLGGEQIPAVTSATQFDKMASEVSAYQGTGVRLAGRIQRVEETDEGYRALVRWLPYPPPKDVDQGPTDIEGEGLSATKGQHYVVTYPGKIKRRHYIVKGNKFVLKGTVEGTSRTVVNVFGQRKDLLVVKARCVRVWETGTSPVEHMTPDTDYPEAVSHTHCVKE